VGPQALRALRWLARRGAPLWTIALLTWLGWLVAIHHLEQSPAFLVRQIEEPTTPDWHRVSAIAAQPLLQVNIASLAVQLQATNPHMRSIRVTRQWPDRLVIDAVPRQPIAQVRLRQFFLLDADGFIFPTGTTGPQPELPIVDGVEQIGHHLTPGHVNTSARLQLAVRLLTQLQREIAHHGEHIALVNVADDRHITFRLRQGIEVRLGDAAHLSQALRQLAPVLAKLKEDNLVPQYIDLRFADPVIGPR